MLKTEIKIEDRKDRLDIIDILFRNGYYAWVESRKDGFYVCWEKQKKGIDKYIYLLYNVFINKLPTRNTNKNHNICERSIRGWIK